jgi:hypothetical protein
MLLRSQLLSKIVSLNLRLHSVFLTTEQLLPRRQHLGDPLRRRNQLEAQEEEEVEYSEPFLERPRVQLGEIIRTTSSSYSEKKGEGNHLVGMGNRGQRHLRGRTVS